MNKLTKGAIAGAAGLTLLLGGGTTFALWNSSAVVAGGTIEAGNLVVSPSAIDGVEVAGVWTDQNDVVLNLETFAASPGDVLVYTKKMHVLAEGDNLVAELTLDAGSINATTPGHKADDALAAYLIGTAVLTVTPDGGIKDNFSQTERSVTTGPTDYTITPGAGIVEEDVTVEVTITFPNGALGAENTMMLGSVTLKDVAVNLTQI
ncbi:alternate-type signal peptide domain-containing protein [Cryobacterium levicorallinum]|uniref:Alternate signal-mediated exported protein, RER_14450 family n=1 Tax=Cryobacterium levicorallinum TaxID=995038 RepID=A0A1I2YQ89_9MICO|nr:MULTISPECIES: alternate-type signal peptide domain-containing protein [Cryobacterium]TFB86055.1 alternate-type signal peptide domain-containing protein [Cryobacterium levicorallinum]SFH26811.1 alternate signal-mediated exported protein, RER_14450 family [Cryobacterium levicorallinum]